ncbi:MAG: PEGA domain-containing protein, partial [Myxococcota bacterium]
DEDGPTEVTTLAPEWHIESAMAHDTKPVRVPRRYPWLWVLLGSFVLGALWFIVMAFSMLWNPSQQRTRLLQKRLHIIELVRQNRYREAASQIALYREIPGFNPDQPWLKRQTRAIEKELSIRRVHTLLRTREYANARHLLDQLDRQWPKDTRIVNLRAKFSALKQSTRSTPQKKSLPAQRPKVLVHSETTQKKTLSLRQGKSRGSHGFRKTRRWAKASRRIEMRNFSPSRISITSHPVADVWLNRKYVGKTPLHEDWFQAGEVLVRLFRRGYHSFSRKVVLRANKTFVLEVQLEPTVPRPLKTKRRVPKNSTSRNHLEPSTERKVPTGRFKKASPPSTSSILKADRRRRPRLPFSQICLRKRRKVRLFHSDPRGISGRHYSSVHRKLCQRIERELARVLGAQFDVRGVTRAWQRYVLKRGRQDAFDEVVMYPLSVAYVVYHHLAKGRSKRRVGQLLVSYELNGRFSKVLRRQFRVWSRSKVGSFCRPSP